MVKAIRQKLMRTTWYPRPHIIKNTWMQSAEVANQHTTQLPIIMQDEGKSPVSGYNANPEHSSFTQTSEPNVYPESRINRIFGSLRISLTKGALETDNLHALRVGVMVLKNSFMDDIDKADEQTGTTAGQVLELQKETTDNQVYPLWNGTKITEAWSGSATVDADVPGLTTNQIIEGTDFAENIYYHAIDYYSNSEVIKQMQRGLKWYTLTRDRPYINLRIKIDSKVKRANKGAFMSIMTHVPQVDTIHQIPVSGDTTAISHVRFDANIRYQEWNQGFNFDRV